MQPTTTSPGIFSATRLGTRLRADGWVLGTCLVALLVATPLIAVVTLAFAPTEDIWQHLASTVLPHYAETTFLLMLGVGTGTLAIGTGTAWLVTMCEFPGRRVFEWALLLPLAVPTYVAAYVFTDVLEYAGPVQKAFREVFGWSSSKDYWFPEIRSLGGATAMMTLVLYPYVYLLSRSAFLAQSVGVLDASRTLGVGPWRGFFLVAMPLARPGIVVGVTLVLMEAINDFGTVDFFAVQTFTMGIYDVWLNMNSTAGAAQLAVVLLMLVVLLIAAERWARRGQRYFHTTNSYGALPRYRLSRGMMSAAFCACLTPVVLGFVFPAAVLANYALDYYQESLTANYLVYAGNSLALSTLGAGLAVIFGLFLAYGVRLSGNPVVKAAARIASFGYAVPGAVLAVGVIIPMARFDNAVDAFMDDTFGISTGLLLSGTVFAVSYGYLVRFLALSYGAVEAGLAKVTPGMDGAARTLGEGPMGTLRRVHFPMIRGSIITAAILVFVDGMKELPMTIILRPFNFETLATFAHQYASDELLEESALASLTIVAAGVLPVIFLSRMAARSRPGQAGEATTARVLP